MARRKRTTGGYRSGLEVRVAKILKDNKVRFSYEREKFKYTIRTPTYNTTCGDCGSGNIQTTRFYTPDFFLRGAILEAKGKFTPSDRNKMLAIVQQHPKLRFVMVFQRNNKLSKASKTTYLDWCAKNGIEAVMVDDLEGWINENLR